MAGTGIVDSFLVYQFVRRLATPFRNWQAYKDGVIDEKGNILVPPKERTPEQKKNFKLFDVMILNIKRLLAKVPGGSSKIATFGAALFLITEEYDTLIYNKNNINDFIEKLKEYIDDINDSGILNEDAPANNVGGGYIKGAAPGEDPVIRKKKKFAGSRVFNVDFYKLWKSRFGKSPYHRYAWYLGEDDVGKEIREYGLNNPKEGIILQDGDYGPMVYLRRPKK